MEKERRERLWLYIYKQEKVGLGMRLDRGRRGEVCVCR